MNRRSRKLPLLGPETLALLMTFLIGGWGLLTIVSSQSHASEPFLLAGKQLMFLILGLAVMWGASKVPFRFYCRNAWILMLAAFGLLLLLPECGSTGCAAGSGSAVSTFSRRSRQRESIC